MKNAYINYNKRVFSLTNKGSRITTVNYISICKNIIQTVYLWIWYSELKEIKTKTNIAKKCKIN